MKNSGRGKNALFRAAEFFDLPGDIIAGASRVEIVGGREVMIENHGGIIEYDSTEIKVNGNTSVISIKGANLELRSMTATEMSVRGQIFGVEFQY